MENATKALLIAAAVLVAILIISLGIVVYNMASETIGSVNFSGQEITAFNDKFTQYEKTNVRGSEVNAMLKTVLNSNLQSVSEGLTPEAGAKFVSVDAPFGDLAVDATTLGGIQADTATLYDVVLNYNATTGFVQQIVVTESN